MASGDASIPMDAPLGGQQGVEHESGASVSAARRASADSFTSDSDKAASRKNSAQRTSNPASMAKFTSALTREGGEAVAVEQKKLPWRVPICPPEVPKTLVTMRMDLQTQAAYLETDQLKRQLELHRKWFKEFTNEAIITIQREIEMEVGKVKQDCLMTVQEVMQELEQHIEGQLQYVVNAECDILHGRGDELESKLKSFEEGLEERLNTLAATATAAVQAAAKAPSSSPSVSLSRSPSQDVSPRRRSQTMDPRRMSTEELGEQITIGLTSSPTQRRSSASKERRSSSKHSVTSSDLGALRLPVTTDVKEEKSAANDSSPSFALDPDCVSLANQEGVEHHVTTAPIAVTAASQSSSTRPTTHRSPTLGLPQSTTSAASGRSSPIRATTSGEVVSSRRPSSASVLHDGVSSDKRAADDDPSLGRAIGELRLKAELNGKAIAEQSETFKATCDDIMKRVLELRTDLDVVMKSKEDLQRVQAKSTVKMDSLQSGQDRIQKRMEARAEQLAEQMTAYDGRLGSSEDKVRDLGDRHKALTEELALVVTAKADLVVIETVRRELTVLRELVTAPARELEARIERIDKSAMESRKIAERVGAELTSFMSTSTQLQAKLEADVGDQAAKLSCCDSELRLQCDQLSALCKSADGRMLGAVERLSQLAAAVEGMAGEADLAGQAVREEVDGLREAVSVIVQDIKEQETAVLFGSRCLSCGRVYDEVQKSAGVVDPRAEKEKAKLFAEVQRALHTTSGNEAKQIKMLSVKVGRPAEVARSDGSGMYFTRDVMPYTCGVEDLYLAPALSQRSTSPESPRTGSTSLLTTARSSKGFGLRQNEKARTRQLPSSPSSARGSRTGGTGGGACSLPACAGPAESAGPQGLSSMFGKTAQPLDDSVDFKHPLKTLVGL
eukprot:gnl/TRDRNA2_/TRDRNA2_85427_c0_seq1.p1 gnl/TRDRNA2_/TRDRNA2_85427_c0~~gnl/TRDRNA2_/TRDRNA2_85427_c0_seq1.p1  ORF type:complete len:900 (+),score=153.00 gnl/TRDRNA2_/TRDRNA2_85427_c0_seq1:54-2753(+)